MCKKTRKFPSDMLRAMGIIMLFADVISITNIVCTLPTAIQIADSPLQVALSLREISFDGRGVYLCCVRIYVVSLWFSYQFRLECSSMRAKPKKATVS